MKLLEDKPLAVSHRPPRRRQWMTVTVTVTVMLVAALAGAYLIVQSGGSDRPTAEVVDVAGDSDRTLGTWAEAATTACTTVAAQHPIMTQGPRARTDAANLAAADVGTRALAAAIRELPPPAAEDERARVFGVVAAGDRADQAWFSLGIMSGEVPQSELSEAAELTTTFVTELTVLTVGCSTLS